jgi:tripartite ATP-independent transporter DctM subunit
MLNDISPLIAVQRMVAGPDSFTLLAIPGFILAGAIMNTGGITERIFDFANKCVGHIQGGLGHANVFASIIFSGMSGTAVADAAGLGKVELKAMKKSNYDEDFSLAITGASSIIGPIIPPSVPAVVFGVASGVSIGKLFAAGIIPGLIMGICMSILIYFYSKKRGYPKERRASLIELGSSFKHAFFALMTPVVIIGGIMAGVVTPTEAAIIAVIYSLILAMAYKSIKLKDIPSFLKETADTTITVMFIVASASLFGWVLASEQMPQVLTNFFLEYISNKYALLFVLMLILLIVGCFMETIAAITILTPIFIPVVMQYGIDPVHFGILMILNLMIGLLTPPVGMVLFVLSSISAMPFEKIAKAVVPYLLLLVAILFFLTYVPSIVTFLPDLIYK